MTRGWLNNLLACPVCRSERLALGTAAAECPDCGARFPVTGDGIVDFVSGDPRPAPPAPRFYDNPFYRRFIGSLDAVHAAHYTPGGLAGAIETALKRDLFRLVGTGEEPSIDLGCGLGEAFPRLGPIDRIVGVDLEMPLLQETRRRYPEATLMRTNLSSLPFRSASLKRVFAIAVLEHVFHLERTLEEIQRCLAPDGRLHVLVPTEGSLAVAAARLVTSARNAKLIGLTPAQSRIAQRIDHCNSVFLIEDSLKKFFRIERTSCWPFRLGGRQFNLAKSYRLAGL